MPTYELSLTIETTVSKHDMPWIVRSRHQSGTRTTRRSLSARELFPLFQSDVFLFDLNHLRLQLHQALYRFFPAPASRPYQMEALPDWHAGSVTSVYTRGTTTNRYEQPSLQCLQSPQHLRSYSSVRRLQQDMILLYDHQRGM
jgi:hypothetical protein